MVLPGRQRVARLGFVLFVALVACSSAPATQHGSQERRWASTPPGTQLDLERWIGKPHQVANLTVFNVYAKNPADVGPFTSLSIALASSTASVHELGAEGAQTLRGQAPQQPQIQSQQASSSGASVNTVVIENHGAIPILVLAGTIVKGGNQDRQIGEDFIVDPGKSTDISAYCVEHGRWTASREGVATGGVFTVEKSLALGTVRVAGQYEKDQSQVWQNVAETNTANKKEAASGTLLASMGDEEATHKRAAITKEALAALRADPEPDRVIGLAYAVDGEVRGIRWFAAPKVYDLFRDTLLETAAFEAMTEAAEHEGASARQVVAEDVMAFVSHMKEEATTDKKEVAGQIQSTKKSADGYASELEYAGKAPAKAAASAANPAPTSTSITVDLFKKSMKKKK